MGIEPSNIDRVINEGLNGQGPLRSHLGRVYTNLVNEEISSAAMTGAKLSQQQAEINARKHLKTYADSQLKPMLVGAAEGKPLTPDQTADMNKMVGMAGAFGQAASAMSGGGGLFGLLPALQSFMTAGGEYIMAAFKYWFASKDDPNAPKSYTEALNNIRADKTVPEFAKFAGVDSAQLMAELKKPAPPATTTAPQLSIELDMDLNTTAITDQQTKQQVDQLRQQGKINGKFATQDAVAVLDGVKANIPGVKGASVAAKEAAATP